MSAIVLVLVIATVWTVRQIVTAPLLDPCGACGAEAGEPCRWGCLGYHYDEIEWAS